MTELIEEDLVYRIQGCIFEVYRVLGHGFLEKVYEKALLQELKSHDLQAESQVPINVSYKGKIVGEYFADIVVQNKVILELKAQEKITGAYEAQILNYLKASEIKVGLLVNFYHPKATIKRLVF